MRQISKKQSANLRIYKKVREIYLNNNPNCEAKLQGCSYEATEIHHKAGKTGDLLFNTKYFLAVCRTCHNWIEGNPKEAKQMNLSVDRLDK